MQYFLLFVSTFFSQTHAKIAFMCKIFVQISTFFSACSAAKSPVTIAPFRKFYAFNIKEFATIFLINRGEKSLAFIGVFSIFRRQKPHQGIARKFPVQVAKSPVTIALFLIITLFSEPSLANTTQNPTEKTTIKAQKPKFHKPETEAERALDEILKDENSFSRYQSLNRGLNIATLRKKYKSEIINLRREEKFTAAFISDYDRQEKETLNSQACKEEGGGLDCYPWGINVIDCSQDSPYGYAKDPYIDMFQSTNCCNYDEYGSECTKCEIKLYGTYYMKKEGGKWKIDGICCGHRCVDSVNLAK